MAIRAARHAPVHVEAAVVLEGQALGEDAAGRREAADHPAVDGDQVEAAVRVYNALR